jgi:hypothetical protein
LADRRALARQRRRSRAFVATHPSLAEMVDAYRPRFLSLCAAHRLPAPAVVLLSGGALYKVGGGGEWLASVGARLRDHQLAVSLLTLPGSQWPAVTRYRAALRALPWEEVRLRLPCAAPPPSDAATRTCMRELVALFATETPPTAARYARTLRRFQRQVGREDYWALCNGGAAALVDEYVAARPGLSRRAARRGLALLLRGFLVENLLAKPAPAARCVYADDAGTGVLAAVGRAGGDWAAYVLGLHSFSDVFYEETIAAWPDVGAGEREHFIRVVHDLLAYTLITADLVICVSAALEQHVRTRFAGVPLPPITTIPNALLTSR